ncbi:helix-turn-helix domain-containing protein [Mycobacterium servetii]|uniref:Helix-turn-helix domain-containing protein n=1 Tax=Mycobacterium servetii TaxID=3237418 RepID=A0ABV4BZU5_9MYCO
MTDADDRALGAVIRRRRAARGLTQQAMAERLGMSPVVYGRVELGNRPVRAVELRDIARTLGVPMDDLVREVDPITAEEMVERAVALRDTAHRALREYASVVVDAVAAVDESDHGALVDDEPLTDADDLAEYLARMPQFAGLTAPADLVPILRRALTDLASSVPLYVSTESEECDG